MAITQTDTQPAGVCLPLYRHPSGSSTTASNRPIQPSPSLCPDRQMLAAPLPADPSSRRRSQPGGSLSIHWLLPRVSARLLPCSGFDEMGRVGMLALLPLRLSPSLPLPTRRLLLAAEQSMRSRGKKSRAGQSRILGKASHIPQLLSYKHSNFQTFFLLCMSWARCPSSVVFYQTQYQQHTYIRTPAHTLLLPAPLMHTAFRLPTTPVPASDVQCAACAAPRGICLIRVLAGVTVLRVSLDPPRDSHTVSTTAILGPA